MIPKGLKVGDTFVDGGRTYKVTKVVDSDRYESIWTGASTPSVLSVKEEVKADVTEEKEEEIDYKSLPYATLKKMCAEKGLDAKGSKNDLVARLEK